MPQPDQQKSHTDCNNICRERTKRLVNSPTCRIIYITNFQYFQIINTSDKCSYLGNCYRNQLSRVLTHPNNSCFSQKPIYWRKSCLRSHKHPPGERGCSRALTQPLLIPNILRPSSFQRRLIRTCHWNENLPPNTKVNHNVNKHVGPQRTDCFKPRSTQRHQQ